VCFVVNSAAAVFTNNLTISETNTAYDGLALVISGASVTVALDGPPAFDSRPNPSRPPALASRPPSAILPP
jgi:hypothetical protein